MIGLGVTYYTVKFDIVIAVLKTLTINTRTTSED